MPAPRPRAGFEPIRHIAPSSLDGRRTHPPGRRSIALAPAFAVARASRLAVDFRREDRWARSPHERRMSAGLLALVAGSVAAHAIVAALCLADRRPMPPQIHEVEVEIVRESPKQPPPVPAPPPAKREATTVETPKPEAPKPAMAQREAPQPAPAAPKPPPAQPSQIDALQKELAALKAEHAALERSSNATEPTQHGRGPLAAGFQATALPTEGDGDGEAASYQEIVFSQLAKAKGIGRTQGREGTAGVRFAIDAAGALVSLDIAVPSGNPTLDAEALAIVRRAAPFPKPGNEDQREFFANVNFVPQGGP